MPRRREPGTGCVPGGVGVPEIPSTKGPEGARSCAASLMGQNMIPVTGRGRTAVRPYRKRTAPTGCQQSPKGPGRGRSGAASLVSQNMNPATGRGRTAVRPYRKRHGSDGLPALTKGARKGSQRCGKSYGAEYESSDRPWAHGCAPLRETTRQPTGCQHSPKGPGRARGGAASLMGQNMNPATRRGRTAVRPYSKRHGSRRVASTPDKDPRNSRPRNPDP